jgi:hypothetical protein
MEITELLKQMKEFELNHPLGKIVKNKEIEHKEVNKPKYIQSLIKGSYRK